MTGRPADPGLDADLATLRDYLAAPASAVTRTEGRAALGRVEAEIARLRASQADPYVDWEQVAESRAEDVARLREEWDAAVLGGGKDYRIAMVSDARERMHAAEERAEAAEAECARLEAERNEYAERLQWLRDLREREGSWGKPYERAMAASAPSGGEPYECEEERDQLVARCARLQQALRGVGNAYGCFAGCTGALPGAPEDGSGHTPACREAREALAGPDEERA